MVEAAAAHGWINRDAAITETLTSIRRAGADVVLSYWALEYASRLAGALVTAARASPDPHSACARTLAEWCGVDCACARTLAESQGFHSACARTLAEWCGGLTDE